MHETCMVNDLASQRHTHTTSQDLARFKASPLRRHTVNTIHITLDYSFYTRTRTHSTLNPHLDPRLA